MYYFIHYACLMKYHTLLPRVGTPSPLLRDQTLLLPVEWVCGRVTQTALYLSFKNREMRDKVS